MFERTVVVAATVAVLVASACAEERDAGSAPRRADGEEPIAAPASPCDGEVRKGLPEGFDPETCWSIPSGEEPVFIGDRVFAVDESSPNAVVAYDVARGEQVWTSGPLPGRAADLHATEVAGEPAIAALLAEHDDGDAVTASSDAWGHAAWPADADSTGGAEPAAHVTTPTEQVLDPTIRWTDQGLAVDDHLLRPGADEWASLSIPPERVVVGDEGLEPTVCGVSGDLLLSYVLGAASPTEDSDPVVHAGWIAHTFDGAVVWDALATDPGADPTNASPTRTAGHFPVVVGDHLLTVVAPEDEDGVTVEWRDAATGEPAHPTPDDLAGQVPVSGWSGEWMYVQTLLSPDGRHLWVDLITTAVLVDVAAGTAQRVATDHPIWATAIDDTTVYGWTDNGHVEVDLATGTAAPFDDPHLDPIAIGGDHAAFDVPGPGLVVARRT